MKTIYEWVWLNEGGTEFLYIKFNGTETLKDCLDCFAEALADYEGDHLKVLVDLRLSENTLGYNEDMAALYDSFLSTGIKTGVAALIVANKFYELKEKIVNEYANINKKPFLIKSFGNFDAAQAWLETYKI